LHLRDAHYPGAQQLGHGQGYLYPHDYPGHWVEQSYLPQDVNEDIKKEKFYTPSGMGKDQGVHKN